MKTKRFLLTAALTVAMPVLAYGALPPGYTAVDLGDGGALGTDMRSNRTGGYAGGVQPTWNYTRGLNDSGVVVGEIFTTADVTSLYVGLDATDAAANGDVNVIEALGRDWASGRAVNNNGLVAGTTRDGNNFFATAIQNDKAFVYDTATDTFTILASSGGSFPNLTESMAMDINDNGRVFGGGAPSGALFRPGYWDANVWNEATQSGGARLTQGILTGGNNNGAAVGMGVRNGASVGGGQQAFVMDAGGTVTFLDQNVNVNLVGDTVTNNPNATGHDINDSGVIVGMSTGVGANLWPGNAGANVPVAWIPTGGGNYDMIVAPRPTSIDNNVATSGATLAINSAGLAVGVTSSTTTSIRGETLGGERDTYEYFDSVNMAGGGFGFFDFSAFLWDTNSGMVVDLDSITTGLPAGSRILAATDINDLGQITVLYTDNLTNDAVINDEIRSAILTIVPEPASAMLLGLGGVMMAMRRRRQA